MSTDRRIVFVERPDGSVTLDLLADGEIDERYRRLPACWSAFVMLQEDSK